MKDPGPTRQDQPGFCLHLHSHLLPCSPSCLLSSKSISHLLSCSLQPLGLCMLCLLLGVPPSPLLTPNSPFGWAWEVLSQGNSLDEHILQTLCNQSRDTIYDGPNVLTVSNLNKFTSIYQIKNPPDETEKKFLYILPYLITEMLAFDISNIISDTFGYNHSM